MPNTHTSHRAPRAPELELADLLTTWRERVDPRQIHGVRSTGRRSPGLTKAEVAKLTGVSSKWIGQLENGHVAKFSDRFLERLALTLRLDASERLTLFLLGSGKPPVPMSIPSEDAVSAVDKPLREFLDAQLPNPAYVSDVAWNIVAHNQPQIDWFPWIPYEPNLMRWAFLYPEAREQLVNWADDWARPFLAQIRVALAKNPDEPGLLKLRDDILEGNEDAARIWADHEALEHPDGHVRRFRLPYHEGAEVPVRIMALAPLRAPNMRVITLVPTTG
ncbi:helix-turn-helix transcriptional regulator [Streptomyces chattanoogensis]